MTKTHRTVKMIVFVQFYRTTNKNALKLKINLQDREGGQIWVNLLNSGSLKELKALDNDKM